MKASDLVQSLAHRFRRPSTWAVILGFGLVWVPARLLAGVTWARMGVWEFFIPAVFLAGHLALSAAPWQWTGDDRPRAPAGRGGLQALAWNTAWVFLLLWSIHDLVRPAKASEPSRPTLLDPEPAPAGAQADRPPRPRPDREDRPSPRQAPPARPAPEEGQDRPDRREQAGPQDRPERPEQSDRQDPPERRDPPDRQDRPDRRDQADRPDRPPPPGPRPELMLLFLNLPFALVLGWFLAEKEQAEHTGRASRERERQARAQALQAQLHPHVLFNILGGLTELVHEDPEAAEEALVGLTELLRMLMKHGSALAMPLGQERALLRRYLEIEAIRLGSRLEVLWTWQEDLDGIKVPPLLLQPLVENAVKHGISPSPEGGRIRVEAIRTGTGLLLRVANTGQPLAPGGPGGVGLSNLRERLALLPEPRPAFDLRQEGAWTVAELRIEGTLKA